jgi:FtsZ-binding cell division protein ZapB
LWRAAAPFEDPRMQPWRDQWAIVLGRSRLPEVRVSAGVAAPVAYGGWRPGVLLPADSSALSDDALRLVFAHEMSHIRRRDPLLAWIPAAAQIVFWFHPLVRLAAREYLAAREEVCDADALRATQVAPHDYGTLLLDYGVGRIAVVPGAASCGSFEGRHLKRRLAMLGRPLHISLPTRAAVAALTLVFVTLAFAPVRWVAAHESGKTSRERGKRSPIAYMIKHAGQSGTRGSVDQGDFESARSIERAERTTVYFRIGDDMWISQDPDVIAEVEAALEPEDRLDARTRVTDSRRAALDREVRALDDQQRQHDDRKDALFARRDVLLERIRALREAGKSTRDVAGEMADLEDEMHVLAGEREEAMAQREAVHAKMSAMYEADKGTWAERERLHGKILGEIARIARRAVEDGRADEFVP